MAAAIVGTRRGVGRAKCEARIARREMVGAARKEAAERFQKEQEQVAKLMAQYDTNKSGFLEPDQITKMLRDYTFNLTGRSSKPTQAELDCLLTLCDKAGDGRISTTELTGALQTWFAYVEKAEETSALLQKHDLTKSGKINEGELKPLLIELNEGADVPDDVLTWVWQQADLTGDGALTKFELTRAIAAWYVWLPEDQPGGKPGLIAGSIDKKDMPEKPAPQPQPQSACCTVS